MRGAAALGIILVHVWMFAPDTGLAAPGSLSDGLMGQLRLGMPMFFVLSGYLIFRPFAAAAIEGRRLPRIGVYALRRVARVGPAYWVAILLTAAVLASIDSGYAQPASVLPSFLLFLQVYDPAAMGTLNPPTWTVAVEASFYLLVPVFAILVAALTARLPDPRHRRAVLAVACGGLLVTGAVVLGQAALNGWGVDVRHTLPARLASFGAGMLVAVLAHGRRASPRGTIVLATVGTALVVMEAGWLVLDVGPATMHQALVDTPASVGFALLIAAVATGRLPGSVVFERGPLQWYGTLSYGVYLVHFPVIYVLRSIDRFPAQPAVAILLVLTISTVLAVVSWHLIEKPAIAWARRRTPSRTPARRPTLAGASGD
ncbi:acyltransferase [Patulibacter sp.]|uniref:acyltransferase family protein n=1 Tax=Patulibacter sp. TaxID=1912859 RepID=UPI002723EC4B|nr:acyltransferase [Patulibacter sp.]MDO9408601.1 acyltransferase [Patulibacter sp.]